MQETLEKAVEEGVVMGAVVVARGKQEESSHRAATPARRRGTQRQTFVIT